MLWVTLAIISPLFMSILAILESHFINSGIKNPFIYSMIIGSCRFLWLILLFFVPFVIPETKYLLFALGSAFCFFLAILAYYYAVSKEEISRIAPWTTISPLIVLLFSTVFLKENLGMSQYAAIVVLVTGALLLSFHPQNLKISRIFSIMLIFLVLYAGSSIMVKLFLEKYSVFDYLIWCGTTTAILSSIGLFFMRKDLTQSLKKMDSKTLRWFIPIIIFWISSAIIGNYSVKLGPVSLVSALGSSGAAFSFLLAFGISKIKPGFLRESFSKKDLIVKATAVCLIVAGAVMIYF
jgi:drug/metabolite transporter (DMT)-like permease